MHTYTIDQLLALKDQYKEPPYPNFSLEEAVRRKKQSGHTVLKRGDNAWTSTMAANKSEGFARVVQGAMNKLAPEKYNDIVTELKQPAMLEENAMNVFIKVVFAKALTEPGYSEMYARLCFDMAKFELTLPASTPASPGTAAAAAAAANEPKKKSMFRDAIIRRTQDEFQESAAEERLKNLTGPEYDDALTAICRRKKANIKFVGQLFLHRVLSSQIIGTIINSILKTATTQATNPYMPQEIDIEVLCELLETVGNRLDTEDRTKLDPHFARLMVILKHPNNKYPHRIKFKIMDSVELRENGWVLRVARAGNQAPTTLKEQQRIQNTVKSPTVTPTRRGGMKFPDTPNTPPSGGGNWRSVVAPARGLTPQSVVTPSSSTAPGAASFPSRAPDSTPKIPFPKRVRDMMQSWLAEGGNEPLVGWTAKFASCDVADDQLRSTVVAEVVFEACLSSKKSAQIEACSFTKVGLALEDDDLLNGFAQSLSKAIDEDVLEDAPKFNERFVSAVSLINENDHNDTAVSLSEVLFLAYDQICSIEGIEPIESLQAVWNKLPSEPTLHPGVIKPLMDVRGTGEGRKQVCVQLLKRLVERELLAGDALKEWFASADAAGAENVKAGLVEEGVFSA